MFNISVIVPVYVTHESQLAYLDECIQSVYDLVDEVVVVNDGSLLDIQPVLAKYPEITWSDLGYNQGTSVARNHAVNLAKHELIYPLDSDDVVIVDKFIEFVKHWNGKPLYHDLLYMKGERLKVHRLLDFDCDLLFKYVGVSSVNVLHTKTQWASIGGWNADIRYLEDGEYNARLEYIYCSERVPEAVVKYRQYKYQKTSVYVNTHRKLLDAMIKRIKDYSMSGCCGKRPGSKINKMKVRIPGKVNGFVLARYVGGKGRGKHYYRGVNTGYGYKVTYGQLINVDPDDITELSLFELASGIKRVETDKVKVKKVERKARLVDVRREPVLNVLETMPDIESMKYQAVLAWLQEVDLDDYGIRKIIEIEEAGKNRKRVLRYLKNRL